jgi:hypothetical protein
LRHSWPSRVSVSGVLRHRSSLPSSSLAAGESVQPTSPRVPACYASSSGTRGASA